MEAIVWIVSAVSFGTILSLAGLVFAAGKHVRSLEVIEDARKREVEQIARIPTIESRITMVESATTNVLLRVGEVKETMAAVKATVDTIKETVKERDRVGVSMLSARRGREEP